MTLTRPLSSFPCGNKIEMAGSSLRSPISPTVKISDLDTPPRHWQFQAQMNPPPRHPEFQVQKSQIARANIIKRLASCYQACLMLCVQCVHLGEE